MTGFDALLQVLADPTSSVTARRDAESMLRMRLEWLRGKLAAKFANLSPGDIEVAVDHLMDVATTSTARYRGLHGEKSAMSWMWRVAANKALDLARARKRAQVKQEAMHLEAERRQLQEEEAEERLKVTEDIVSKVEELVRDTLSPAEAREAMKRMRLGLELIWTPGMTHTMQREMYGYLEPGEADPEKIAAADNVLAQHRHRGRDLLARFLAKLVSMHRLDEQDAALFAAANRLIWPPGAKRRAAKSKA